MGYFEKKCKCEKILLHMLLVALMVHPVTEFPYFPMKKNSFFWKVFTKSNNQKA